jgi:hypothetical protein
MKGFFVMCGAAIALTGCASIGTINNSMAQLRGQPLEVAVMHYGPPAQSTDIGGKIMYSWHASQSMLTMTPNTSNTTGTVSGPYGSANYASQTTSMSYGSTPLFCEAYVIINGGLIESTGVRGQVNACQAFLIK